MVSRLMKALAKNERSRFTDLQVMIPNPRTLSAKLRGLTTLAIVEKRGGAYGLTERGKKVAVLIAQIEDVLTPVPPMDAERVPHPAYRPVLARLCEQLLHRYGDRLVGALLFGSVARGDWKKDSDIDLLVVLDRLDGGRRAALHELLSVREELRSTAEYRAALEKGFVPTVEFYPLGTDEAPRFRRMYLDALTEGIVIFERDGFLSHLIESFKMRLKEMGSKRIDMPGAGHYWVLADIKPGEVIEL